ncbi:MAG: hypothetical protein LC687_01695, partial [Actinobacteria bacterium]|nr:hypothetical protein [Actinomycetota bacterium]
MAELKAGSWPITDVDIDAIDPHEQWIPRGPEADKEAAAEWRPWGLEDRSDSTNIKKEWIPSDEGKYKTKDDEYMNKEPKETMKESHLDSNTIYRTKARLKSQGIDVEPSMVVNYLEGTQRIHKLKTWTNKQLAANYKSYLSFKETKTKDKYMSKLREKIREAIEDAAIDTREWDAGDIDEIDLDGGVTEIVLDNAAIDRLAKTLGIDSQVIRDCALAEEDGAYSYEEDDFVDSMTDTFMGDDDRDISDMPRHNATDWDDTEDPSFNSDFMESRSRARRQRIREELNYSDKEGIDHEVAAADPTYALDSRVPSGRGRGGGGGKANVKPLDLDRGGDQPERPPRKRKHKARKRRGFTEADYGMPDEDYQGDANEDVANDRDVADDPSRLRYPSVTPDRPDNAEEESSREAVDVEGQSSLPEYLDYDSSEDTEFSSGLDSFQHTHNAPQGEMVTEATQSRGYGKQDRLLRERFAKEQTRLREARGQKAEVVNQYLSQASNPDYDDFIDWAQNEGIQEVPNKYYFNNLLKKRGGVGSGGVEEVEEREPFNPEDAPEELQQLMSLYAQASEEDASLEPTVEQKFKGIYAIGYRTAKGRALKRHAFICGSPGIGKTFTVAKAVEKGATEGKQLFAKFRGSIGKSLSAILAFLWMHRENYVVLLDDADGFLTGSTDEVMNTLKAAMDTDDPMVSTSSPHIRKNVAKMVGMSESERWPAALNFDTSRLHEGIMTAVDR